MGYIDPIIDFFHYAKHEEDEFLDLFNDITEDYKTWCPFNHDEDNKTDTACYSTLPVIKDLCILLDSYLWLFSYLEINSLDIPLLEELVNDIKSPRSNYDLITFECNLERMVSFIKSHKEEFFKESKKFTCLESERLWESVRCFKNNSFLAATILTVSAIESRLHTLIRAKNKKLYSKEIEKSPIYE